MIDKKWEEFGASDWAAFAEAWLAEITEPASAAEWSIGHSVVLMNFTATPEQQWTFILEAVSLAESDDELAHIAAGPIEHILGWHGERVIELVEQQAASDPKFARTLTGVWKYLMTDEVWLRIQALQQKVVNPLQSSEDTKANS